MEKSDMAMISKEESEEEATIKNLLAEIIKVLKSAGITKQKRKEAILKPIEKRLRFLAETSPLEQMYGNELPVKFRFLAYKNLVSGFMANIVGQPRGPLVDCDFLRSFAQLDIDSAYAPYVKILTEKDASRSQLYDDVTVLYIYYLLCKSNGLNSYSQFIGIECMIQSLSFGEASSVVDGMCFYSHHIPKELDLVRGIRLDYDSNKIGSANVDLPVYCSLRIGDWNKTIVIDNCNIWYIFPFSIPSRGEVLDVRIIAKQSCRFDFMGIVIMEDDSRKKILDEQMKKLETDYTFHKHGFHRSCFDKQQ